MFKPTAIILTLSSSILALDAPQITAAARLAPRQNDPLLVGYISEGGSYNVRSCDATETVSTSGNFFQCCPTTGSSCPFYTACQDNTLQAAGGVTVDCFVNSALTCNTGLVVPTAGAAGGVSYLACWQTALGTGAFEIVQSTEGGSGAATATTSGSGSNTASNTRSTSASTASSGQTTRSSSGSGSSASTAGSSASSSANVAGAFGSGEQGLGGRLVGALVALVAPVLL